MANLKAMQDDLTDVFIDFIWRQENPIPSPNELKEQKIVRYQSDYVFNAKVKSMVAGVMSVVVEHV